MNLKRELKINWRASKQIIAGELQGLYDKECSGDANFAASGASASIGGLIYELGHHGMFKDFPDYIILEVPKDGDSGLEVVVSLPAALRQLAGHIDAFLQQRGEFLKVYEREVKALKSLTERVEGRKARITLDYDSNNAYILEALEVE